ncbi:MAG: hypothetical protein ACR2M6_02735 [Vampirovibrionia bacterium]
MSKEVREQLIAFFGTKNAISAAKKHIEEYESSGHILIWNDTLKEQYIVHYSDFSRDWKGSDLVDEYRYDTLSFFSPPLFDELEECEFKKNWIACFQRRLSKKYPKIGKTMKKCYLI